jgi:hypothetical protein
MHRPIALTVRTAVLFIALASAGPSRAAKVDLVGVTVVLSGTHKMILRDDDRRLTCPAQEIVGEVTFAADRQWTGVIDDHVVGGIYKQKDPKGRKIVFKLDQASLDELNQAIDNFTSACILSIPDGRPVRIKDLSLKGKINKRRDTLRIKGVVQFRSREVGVWWDMRGDSSDTYKLRLKGPFAPAP